ncbi:acyl-CoA thioesterase [Acinetobacter soli]|uniref:acyl-CoA thioesterase n=1 Tax=Acinetobacter soli TaxID=487316 RepID=UPI000B4D2BA2|nr:acyl-CoA thioesterase [Acinetobacter soli]
MTRLRKNMKAITVIRQWTTEQDGYLIEHADFAISELIQLLPYTEEEIKARKKVLGLLKRERQFRKIMTY